MLREKLLENLITKFSVQAHPEFIKSSHVWNTWEIRKNFFLFLTQ